MKDRRTTISPEILEAINGSVAVAVRETVNGKIDNLTHTVHDYIAGDMEWKKSVNSRLNINDTKFQELEPVTTGLKVTSGLRRFVLYIGGFGIGGAIIYYLKELIK